VLRKLLLVVVLERQRCSLLCLSTAIKQVLSVTLVHCNLVKEIPSPASFGFIEVDRFSTNLSLLYCFVIMLCFWVGY
jgi:hypothetical protein